MKLRRLRLENFRQHQDSTIEFRDGMTAIVGPNGSGKTTILEAISYALYGEQRAKKDSIRFLWADRKQAKVTLEFERGENVYEVMRSETTAHMKLNGTEIAVRLEPTRDRCIRELGLTYDHFKNSFCAEQKDLGFLNFRNAAARDTEVARMLGFDVLQDAAKLGLEKKDTLNHQLAGQELSQSDATKLQTDLIEATQALVVRESEVRASEEKLASLKAKEPLLLEISIKGARYLALDIQMGGIADKADILRSNRIHADTLVEQWEKKLAEKMRLAPQAARFEALQSVLQEHARLRGLDEERRVKQGQVATLQEDLNRLSKELAGIERQDPVAALAEVKAALQAVSDAEQQKVAEQRRLEQQNRERLRQRTALESQRKALQAKLRESEALVAAGKCPKCGQPTTESLADMLAETRALIQAAEEEEARSDATTRTLEKEQAQILGEFEARLTQAKSLHTAAQDRESKAKQQDGRAKDKETEIGRKKTELARIQAELVQPSAYAEAQHAKDQAESDGLRESHKSFQVVRNADEELAKANIDKVAADVAFKTAQDEYAALKTERMALPFKSKDEAKQAQDEFSELKGQVGMVTGGLQSQSALLDQLRKDRKRIEKEITEFEVKRKLILETKHRVTLHAETSRLLNQCRTMLNDQAKPDLEMRASLNLSQLTSGRYTQLILDKNWGASVVDADEKVKDVISGGEEDIVALALRLALSELIQERQGHPLSLLILDEVFGSLDPERRGAVLDRLRFLTDRFQQILVISHVEGINEMADQCIFVSRDPESKASRVSELPLASLPTLFDLTNEGSDAEF